MLTVFVGQTEVLSHATVRYLVIHRSDNFLFFLAILKDDFIRNLDFCASHDDDVYLCITHADLGSVDSQLSFWLEKMFYAKNSLNIITCVNESTAAEYL